MSYASAVKDHGPKQSAAEKMPDAVPEILHEDSGVHSINSLQSESVQIPSYSDQQLAKERADEAEEEAKEAADKAAAQVGEFEASVEQDLSNFEDKAGKRYDNFAKEAKSNYDSLKSGAKDKYVDLKKEAGIEGDKAKKNAKSAEQWAEKNKGNPVVIGNVVVIGALGALLGTGAYRLHREGSLTWKVASAWAGVVGLFAVGDYYVSQYFFKQYPTKK